MCHETHLFTFVDLEFRGVAKPWHTRAHARATFACALAFACRSFKLAPHMNSNESAS